MSSDDVIDTLNDLIETSKDGEYGFRACIEHLHDEQTRQLFARRADECARAATVLRALVVELGGDAQERGSVAGAVHRGWVAVKGTLSGHSDLQLLEATESGEDKAMAAYRETLNKELPQRVRAVVEEQFEGVQRNHAQVRALRDRERTLRV